MSSTFEGVESLALMFSALGLVGWASWISMGRLVLPALTILRKQPRLLAACALLWLAFSAILMRPHEDTFIGLDTSCYRHMTAALSAGRPLTGPDPVLLEAPRDIRVAFLLMPDMRWRNTRDRSFELRSLDTSYTQPFFYPLLPFAAAGFDKLAPGAAADYLMPLIGALFVGVFLMAGAARDGGWGVATTAALLLGSPLPAWFLRGYFPEALGALLLCGVVLHVLLKDDVQRPSAALYFPIALAVSLHPLLVTLALPVGLWIGWGHTCRRGDLLKRAGWIALGVLPLYVMTQWICQPYGRIFDLHVLLRNLRTSGEHRVVMAAALGVVATLAASRLIAPSHRVFMLEKISGWLKRPWFRCLALLLALTPFLAAYRATFTRAAVLRGASELLQGLQAPLAVLILLLGGWIVWRARPRWVLLWALMLAMMPAFFYLKGVEQVGLWSQRRLLPWFLLAAVALLPGAEGLKQLSASSARRGTVIRLALVALLGAAAFHNLARWPAPFVSRFEAGADEWIARLRARIGSTLTFIDYHPYSFPLAVDGRTRVLGLGEQAHARLGRVIRWLRERAAEEPVFIATAFVNPGMEEGFALESIALESGVVSRVRSRAALPAEQYSRSVQVEILRAIPAGEEPIALRKIFDGGPLALRGSWLPGPRRIRDAQGLERPAMWSRADSAIVGPSPRSGESLRITVSGISARRDERAVVTLYLETESGERSPPIPLASTWTETQVEWAPTPGVARTAVYRVRSMERYDPAREGIRGYPKDLGALLHRMDIEIVSTHTPRNE